MWTFVWGWVCFLAGIAVGGIGVYSFMIRKNQIKNAIDDKLG